MEVLQKWNICEENKKRTVCGTVLLFASTPIQAHQTVQSKGSLSFQDVAVQSCWYSLLSPDKAFNTEVVNTSNALPSGIYFRLQNKRYYANRKTVNVTEVCRRAVSVTKPTLDGWGHTMEEAWVDGPKGPTQSKAGSSSSLTICHCCPWRAK